MNCRGSARIDSVADRDRARFCPTVIIFINRTDDSSTVQIELRLLSDILNKVARGGGASYCGAIEHGVSRSVECELEVNAGK